MEYQTIQAEARSEAGKGAARRTRRAGRIPAIAYGGGVDAVALSVDPRALRQLHKGVLGWNTPFMLTVDGSDDVGLAMLKDVQKHPTTGALLHADFVRLTADGVVEVNVPVRLLGKAPGIEEGGKLNQPMRALVVRCLPSVIPDALEIDVSELDVGDKVMLSGVATPDGISLVFVNDATVVNVFRSRVVLEEDVVDLTDEEGEGEGEEEEEEEAE